MSSFTDTIGFMSPHIAGAGGVEGAGFDDEHADERMLATNRPAHATKGVLIKPFDIRSSNDASSLAGNHLTVRIPEVARAYLSGQ